MSTAIKSKIALNRVKSSSKARRTALRYNDDRAAAGRGPDWSKRRALGTIAFNREKPADELRWPYAARKCRFERRG